MMRKSMLVPILLAFFLFGGCTAALRQPSHQVSYYTLEYEPPPPADREKLPFVIAVSRFGAAPVYDGSRIVYRERRFEYDSYVYHRWRAKPAELAGYFLARDLRESGLFAAVQAPDRGSSPTHLIQGTVEEFLEWDGATGWEARLTLTIALLKAADSDPGGRVLFQKTFAASRPCASREVPSLIEAMSGAMAEVSRRVREEIYHTLHRTEGGTVRD